MDAFHELMAKHKNWAKLEMTIEEISRDNKALVRDLSRYDPKTAIPLIASLLTIPEYQSNCVRLEILAALAVVHCEGRKKAHIGQVVHWFYQIGKSACVLAEDPAEDVFVSLVQDPSGGDYRILEGIWEAAGFYTERVFEVVDTMPDTGHFSQIKRCARALLKISDIVCERSGLHRYQTGSDECCSALLSNKIPARNTLISRVVIAFEELDAHQIGPDDIAPFLLDGADRRKLAGQEVGISDLDRHPFVVLDEGHITIALPTAISVAMRDYVLENVIAGGLVNGFDKMLAANYARTISQTQLLGGPMRAPVVWGRVANGRCAAFHFEVDKGYVISFHLLLPSVQGHLPGGFKNIFVDDGTLTAAAQVSINSVVKHFDQWNDFKEGLIIIAGCGWGKGYATKHIELDHQKWRAQSMSVADLLRASWLFEMSPLHYWRLQDGLESITKAGVNILNVNGLLNLIGWVRSNDGHFVPHAHLPEGRISPERPLMLQPPMNLLRDVRASSDQGYDRHSVQDNTTKWHEVQRVGPKPFFSSVSSLRVYASFTDVQAGRLTAVYEGHRNYWITISAPSISDKDAEYRLWEMLLEWLHRTARAIDEMLPDTLGRPSIRVVAEFRDAELPDHTTEKPTLKQLEALCSVEWLSEPNAKKIVFKPGFLNGFRIAENIAERLVARTLAQAYLALLEVGDPRASAIELEPMIVPNNNARHFHLFQARAFLDFTKQYLPKKLISIDPLDDAAAKIGLGWRALGDLPNSTITGREKCNVFLARVVDILVNEVSEILRGFERISTITRLMENIEKAHSEEDHWNKTSAAVLGLHGAAPGTIERFVEQTSKFAGAGIASRVLTEMAVCECPLGKGTHMSDIQLSKLIAKVALVVRIGGFSDAIRFNALPPELTISPLGDILFRNEFGENVVEPMLAKHMSRKIISISSHQSKNYDAPSVTPEVKGKISEEFWTVWEKEMGFNIDQARQILDCFDDKGIQDGAPIFMIRLSEAASLIEKRGLPADIGTKFVDRFSLSPRPRWDKPPKGFSLRDVYPWRFGRRLSFASRPLVKLDEEDDPTLLIAPNALRMGVAYVLSGAFEGSLGQEFFATKEMRDDWWGKASEGHSFNSEVAKALVKKGWTLRENIGLPEILNKKLDHDHGDIDVLAWKPECEDVLLIESKDLSLARNYSEIAALLADYQGEERDGKADKLKRHLDRVQLMKAHSDEVAKFTGIERPRIVSWLVCSGVVPIQFAKIDALKDTSVGSIEDVVSS